MNWKLGKKFSVSLMLIFLFCAGLKIVLLARHFNYQAELAITERAELVLNTMQAAREYTQMYVQPRLTSTDEGLENFYLESVPNFAARKIFEDFRQRSPDFQDFSYKEATPNPTNPDDRTDEFESIVFKELQSRPQNSSGLLSGYRETGESKLFYLAKPLVMNDPKCLDCHGTPRNAPKNLIDMYGNQNGFGWKLNDVVAAQMVYVPADQIFQRGRQSLYTVTAILLGLFTILFVITNLLLWQTVIRPLQILTKVAQQMSSCTIRQQESHVKAPSKLTALTQRQDEPGQLARAFHFMIAVLSQREQELQQAVHERTVWLEQEMQERQAAQNSLQTYSHTINHDLRNLTMGVSSLVQGILFQKFGTSKLSGEENDSRVSTTIQIDAEALQMVQQSCDRQLNLMSSLMSVEATDIWRSVIHPETIDLAQFMEDLEMAYPPKLGSTSSTIKVQIPPDIPQIYADPNQLKRVYENLIDNALKFNPDGVDIIVTATVSHEEPSKLRCSVADNGVGIELEKQQNLFGLYARGQSNGVSGHGLGLYICRKIIEAHGGIIDVKISNYGVEFWFTLPI